jgi:hypothetical protein
MRGDWNRTADAAALTETASLLLQPRVRMTDLILQLFRKFLRIVKRPTLDTGSPNIFP